MDKQDHKLKIGLLGGSFNPAHEGHLEISLTALERLELDEVWWLVSPGNPLKDLSDMAEYDKRFSSAEEIANHAKIIISDFEKKVKTRYTIDTLSKIIESYPDNHFIWLMGADNLANFHKWNDWKDIVTIVPFAIFNRPSYSKASLESVAANYLSEFKIDEKDAKKLYDMKPPAWVYFRENNNPLSSTELRKKNEQ